MIEVKKEEECIVDIKMEVKTEVGFAGCSSVSDSSCDTNTPISPFAQGRRRITGAAKRSSQAGWTAEELNVFLDERMLNVCIAGKKFLILNLSKDLGQKRRTNT